jgi:hypothetical protein
MGLDMYLHRKTYVKNWEHMKPEELHSVLVKKGGEVREDIAPAKVSEVVEEFGYWRKANAIHNWFVENVQDGEDDCKEYSVSEEDLKELLSVVNTVLDASELIDGDVVNGYKGTAEGWKPCLEKGKTIKNPAVAKKLLPVTEGFFFGSTDYDQWYYGELVETKKILEEALKAGGDFYYESSW